MRIQYESTIAEAADAQIRLFEKAKTAKKWKLQGLIIAPFVSVLTYYIIPDEQNVKLCFAVFAGITFIIVYFVGHKKSIRKRTEKLLSEHLGSDQPYPVEYELDEESLIFRRMGTELRFDWNGVKEINEGDKDIEFVIDKGGIAIIPNRAFANPQERQEWLDFVKNKTGLI